MFNDMFSNINAFSTVPRRYSAGMAENDFDAEQLIKGLTRKPGVYRMFDIQGKVSRRQGS